MAYSDIPPAPRRGDAPPGHSANLAERREHSLMAMVELARALDLRLNESELAQLGLFNLIGHFGAPHGVIWLRPEGGGPLEVAAVAGLPMDEARSLAAALDSLPAAWPAGETVRISTAAWLAGFGEAANRGRLKALARLEGQHDWLGFVALSSPRSGRFYGAIEGELLQASMGIVAAAIENQRLVRGLHLGHAQLAAANERMREMDRLRSEMLQNLNHEFRTPIAVILGAVSCLRERGLDEVHRGRFLDMVETHAAQVHGMVSMLLDHAELMSVRAELRCEPTDVVASVREAISLRSRGRAAAQQAVNVTTAAGPHSAQADPARLRRVFEELFHNALKFSPGDQAVTVHIERRTGEAGDIVAVEVSDHGPGMTAEQLAVAFQPFRQGDGSSTRIAGGLGIGLPACRRMIELMGGALALESEPGRGTTARVELRAA